MVTGRLDPESLPTIGALRRRFERLVVLSIIPEPMPTPSFPGVTVLAATSVDALVRSWQREALK